MDSVLTAKIFRKAGLFVSALTLLSGSAMASPSCQHIDYNEKPDSPFRKMPIYDQGKTGICYAYAASQMIDYYRLSHGESPSDLTNPVYAAYATSVAGMAKKSAGKSRAEAESLYGGFPEDVIATLKRTGSCPASEVKRNLSAFKADASVSDANVLAFLEDTYKTIEESPKDIHGNPTLSAASDALAQAPKAVPTLGTCEVQYMAMEAALRGYVGMSAKMVLADVFRSCQAKNKPVNVPETETTEAGSDSFLQAKLDEALGRNPVSVGVCSKFFDDLNYQGLNGLQPPFVRRAVNNVKEDCGGHGVVVTGRRESGGRCQYLIRNSWGPYWNPPAAASCACIDLNGQYWETCKQPDNVKEYVGCWFDAEAMVRNTSDVTAFK